MASATPKTTAVFIHLADGPVPAGWLEYYPAGADSWAAFHYGNRYIQRPDRVAARWRQICEEVGLTAAEREQLAPAFDAVAESITASESDR